MGFGGAGGAKTFLELTDTPSSYAGSSKKVSRVNAAEDQLEFGLPVFDVTKFFDGSVDTPTDKAWEFESPVPFTQDIFLYFSPLIKNVFDQLEVYVIDQGTHFWKYNLKTKQWAELSSPNYELYSAGGGGGFNRSLAVSPDGTKLACISDGIDDTRGGKRIEVYNIAGDSWAASPVSPDVQAYASVVSGLVWEDNDKIWCWASKASAAAKTYCKCINYVPSTTTWTQYATVCSGLSYVQAPSAAIKADSSIVFGGYIGASSRAYCKYTVAGDSYDFASEMTAGTVPATAADRSRLWSFNTTTGRQGYLQISDETLHDDIFAENTDRLVYFGDRLGVNEDADSIIAESRNVVPKVMSCTSAGMYLLDTLVATNWTLVVVDKPNDGYAVTALANGRYVVIEGYGIILLEAATWSFYYPKAGNYTPIKLYDCPLEGG
ncbi:hypothetical protein ES705_22135 [subsurface metagenome]